MTFRVLISAAVLAGGLVRAADAPDSAHVRGESTTSRKRLVEAEQKILAGKTADAIDELQRILDDVGDTLVTADGKQFFAARQYVHQFLAKLPDAELKKYRDRVEDPAAKLLALGRATREPRSLLDLLDRYAVSRPAEEATLLLAELAFERGEFATAERFWKTLLPAAEGYAYPGPKTPAAVLRAKVILATIYRGDRLGAEKLLEEFQKVQPNAEGRLAGRSGKLAEILAATLNEARPALSATNGSPTWATLGGSPARDGHVAGMLPRNWPSRPTWKTPIPAVDGVAGKGGLSSIGVVKSLAFHPVVMGGRAYLADAGRVISFDLRTGAAKVVFDQQPVDGLVLPKDELRLPTSHDADFTLTASDGRLYFRFGYPELFPTPQEGEPAVPKPSVLICLGPPAGSAADALPTDVIWKRFPPAAGEVSASWEGSPLVVGGHVLAAFVRSEGGRTVHAVACYREDGDRPLWVTDVCEAATLAGRARQELLTLAGRNVVFCSQSGVVAAVNARTGKPAWAYRYPRIRRFAADGRHRDLSPPVAADGRVFVAPNDSDRLFAFDAETGKLLWDEGPILVDHLVGTAAGKVVATIAGPQRGIRAYDTATGSCDPLIGWKNHDDPLLPTFGRGILSDDFIAWPTSSPTTSQLYTIRLADGTVAAQPVRGLHGNLAFAGNVLLAVTATEVCGYVQDGGSDPEPSQPRPPLLGAIPWTPSAPSVPVRAELQPVLGEAAKLDRISPVPPGDGLNVGDLAPGRWLVRVRRGEAEIVRPAGPPIPLRGVNPTSAVAAGQKLLLANDAAVSLIDPATGHGLWTVGQPNVTAVVPIRGGLVLRIGEQHLLAYELASGKACWALDSRKQSRWPEPVIESAARFLSVVPFENRLLVQLSTGRRWLIDAATGKVLHDAPTADRAWRTPPARLGEGQLVVADGPGQVAAIDTSGHVAWTFDAKREASLTGEPPQVRVAGDSAYVFVPRSHGTDIDRLSAVQGKRRWQDRPAFVPADAIHAAACDADDERLYVPTRDRLFAFKLDTGREAWQAPLPHAAAWRTIQTRNRLIVLPTEAVATEANPVAASFLRFPAPRRMLGLLGTLADDYFRGTVPVLLFDPRTGRLQQRLDMPAAGAVSAEVAADGIWIAAGGAIYRLQ